MRLTFLGHACFLIQTANFRFLTDPFSEEIGYHAVNENADVVTLSHDNPKWHSCLDAVRGDFQTVRGLEWIDEKPLRVGGATLEWIPVWENSLGEGPNAMLKLSSERLRVLHMGDIGHPVDEATLQKCGEVDILLAPAGGAPTIELEDLLDFVARLKPRIVVPMHFAVPGLAMQLRPVEDLIAMWDQNFVRRETAATLEFNAGIVPKAPTLCVLPPKRLVSS